MKHSNFLALTVAALASFATAAHADERATTGSTSALLHAGQSLVALAMMPLPPKALRSSARITRPFFGGFAGLNYAFAQMPAPMIYKN
jgi:hypothetical protein